MKSFSALIKLIVVGVFGVVLLWAFFFLGFACDGAEIPAKELLRNKVTELVKGGKLAEAKLAAETLSALECADTAVEHRRVLSLYGDAAQGVLNIYKSAPQILKVAQYWNRIQGERDKELNTVLNVLAPAFIQIVQKGCFDEAPVKRVIENITLEEKARTEKWERERKARELQRQRR